MREAIGSDGGEGEEGLEGESGEGEVSVVFSGLVCILSRHFVPVKLRSEGTGVGKYVYTGIYRFLFWLHIYTTKSFPGRT